MYFTDVCFSEEEHTDTGLADAAADSIWKFLVQDCLLERKLTSVVTACNSELLVKCVLIHTNTHRREFQCNVKNRIVNENVAV
mgnify:CR=1 FL=1